jgi:hypothetical protein
MCISSMAKATVIGEFPAIASKARSALRIVAHSGVRSRRKLMPALGRKLTITNDRSARSGRSIHKPPGGSFAGSPHRSSEQNTERAADHRGGIGTRAGPETSNPPEACTGGGLLVIRWQRRRRWRAVKSVK